MKTFWLVVALGILLFLGYRRAVNYGYPWEDQVVITRAEHSMRGRDAQTVYLSGEVSNRTTVAGTVVVDCHVLPGGATISPKEAVTLDLPAKEARTFQMAIKSRQGATGVDCKVSDWNTGTPQEREWLGGFKRMFDRFK